MSRRSDEAPINISAHILRRTMLPASARTDCGINLYCQLAGEPSQVTDVIVGHRGCKTACRAPQWHGEVYFQANARRKRSALLSEVLEQSKRAVSIFSYSGGSERLSGSAVRTADIEVLLIPSVRRRCPSLGFIPDANTACLTQQQTSHDKCHGRHNHRVIKPGINIPGGRDGP